MLGLSLISYSTTHLSSSLGLANSFSDDWLIKFMPTMAHELATAFLSMQIARQYAMDNNNADFLNVCLPLGATTYTLQDNPRRIKQADASFKNVNRPNNALPHVVVEVGVTETRNRLIIDAGWWLETGQVHLVILIKLKRTHPRRVQIELHELRRLRSGPHDYPPLVQGVAYVVPPLDIRYSDLGIPNNPNVLSIPLEDWSRRVWESMD
ncbi:hypothetical protein C8J57DRAFT_643118 [Mycena rebaudengoi]|nr:hypothetical protein C8J57DRAFT_643118 [Mycena rebaudengoi]